mgnify:CR=1 FL=1
MAGLRRSWRSRTGRAVRLAVGVVGIAAAVVFAARGMDLGALGRAAWWQWAMIAVGVVVNLAATTAIFQLVTRAFCPQPAVAWPTMARLIAASTLLNYVPVVRLGLWSRAAYLKAYHGVAVRDSAAGLGLVLGVSLAVVVAVAGVGVAVKAPAWAVWGGFAGVGLALMAALTLITARLRAWRAARPGLWPAIRVVDVVASGLRLWVALSVVGVDVAWHEAVLLGCAGTLGRLAAVTPNGLGLSEWLIALVGASRAMGQPVPLEALAAAAVIDRAVEVGVIVPAGLWGLGVLRRGKGVTPGDRTA